MSSRIFTCHVENRLETQAKPTYFHWVFDFNTVTQHSYTRPVVFSELRVIVCIKCWTLLKNKILFKYTLPVCIKNRYEKLIISTWCYLFAKYFNSVLKRPRLLTERSLDALDTSALHCDISRTTSEITLLVMNFRSGLENAANFRSFS